MSEPEGRRVEGARASSARPYERYNNNAHMSIIATIPWFQGGIRALKGLTQPLPVDTRVETVRTSHPRI